MKYDNMTHQELEKELSTLLQGCGKEMDTGDCWHYRPNGNKPAYCSNCSRKIKIIREKIGVIKNAN